jgi:hypothetical protein
LEKFPNWKQALDEEGERGQDETTLKPDDEQRHIGEQTQSTAADAIFPNGRKHTAVLSATMDLWKGDVEYLSVYGGRSVWQVDLCGSRWTASLWAEDTRTPGDDSVFPLRVVSRVPSILDDRPLSFTLMADGKITPAPAQAAGPISCPLPYTPQDISASLPPEPKLPMLDTKDGRPSEESLAWVRKEVKERGYFGFDLLKIDDDSFWKLMRSGKTPTSAVSCLARSFTPLVEKAKFCRLYDLAQSAGGGSRPPGRYLQRKGSSVMADLRASGITQDYRFWWTQAVAVLCVPATEVDFAALFSAVSAPTEPELIGNLGCILPQSAISFARRRTEDDRFVCFIPRSHSYGLSLQMFAAPAVALRALDVAVVHLQPLPVIRTARAHYWVRPFEQREGIGLLTDAKEAKDAGLLAETLRRAMRHLDDPAASWRALAAAELIAAARGWPVPNYNPHTDINRSVKRCAKRLRGVPDAVVELARDVVAILARRSSLANKHWLSQQAVDAWQSVVVHLHWRLKSCLQSHD